MENQSQNTSVPVSGSRGNVNVPAAFDVPASTPTTPVSGQIPTITPLASLGSSQPSSPPATEPRSRPPRGRRSKWLYGGIALAATAAIGAGIIIWRNSQQQPSQSLSSTTVNDIASRFSTLNIPLKELGSAGALVVDASKTLSINGQLKANNGFVIAPTKQPTAAVAGQIYYDQDSNALNYFNGSQFIAMTNQTSVNSIAGASGALTLGNGLSQSGNQLSSTGVLTVQGQAGNVTFTAGPGLAVNGTTLSSTGILSFGGQTGAITVGNGLGLTGNQLNNTGIVSVSSSTPSLVVTNDGNGNITLANNGSGTGTVQSPGGTTNRLAKFTGVQTIADSLLGDDGTTVTVNGNLAITGNISLSSPLSVAQGGTGVGTLASNGVLVGGGTSAISSVTSPSSGLCLISTTGAPSWQACPGGGATIQNQFATPQAANFFITNAGATTDNTATIRQSSTQTGSLLLFQDNAGATTAMVKANGSIYTGGVLAVGTTSLIPISANLYVKSSSAGNIVAAIRGTTSQTGDLLQLQDNSGNFLSAFGATGALTLGRTGAVAGVANFADAGSSFTATLNTSALTANRTISLPDLGGTICTTAGNCSGVGGGVTTAGGTTNKIAKFTGTQAIGDSLITDNGTLVTIGGNLSVTGTTTLATPLSVANGGTGANTLASNGVIVGNGTGALSSVTAGSANQCLVSTAGAPNFATCDLQFAYNNAPGATTPEVKLNTGKGSFDIQDADATIASNLFNVRSSNAGGFGQILFGVGNNGAIITQNAVNSTSAFVVENAAGAAQLTVDTTNSKVIIGTLQTNTITPTGALTIGATGQSFTMQGNASSTITATNSGNTTGIVFQTPTANVTYRLLTAGAGTYDICTTIGNCAGTGSGVTTPGGTAGKIAKFTAGQAIADSIISDNGSTVTIGGALSVNTVTPTGALTIGATGQNLTLQGATVQLTSTAAGVTNTLAFATPSSGNKTITLPNISGTVCLDTGNCLGGGGGGANTSLSNLTAVAINTSLLPSTAAGINIGSGTLPIGDIYLGGTSGTPATNNFKITGASTGGTRTITLPDASGTVCLQSSTSCGFAPTTGGTGYIQNTTTLQTASAAIQSAADSDITLRIRERSTQSADILRLEDSNGNYQLLVDNFGSLHAANQATFDKVVGIGIASSSGEQLRIAPDATTTTVLSLRVSVSQTADIIHVDAGGATPFAVGGTGATSIQNTSNSTNEFTVNNAAGRNLLRVDSTNSALIVGNITATSGAGVVGLIKLADGTNDNFAASLQLAGALTGNVNFQLPNGYTGNQAVCISGGNCNYAPSTGGSGYIQNGTSMQTANYAIQSASAGSIAAVVRGATSQTAAIFEVQNSSGNPLLSVAGNTNFITANNNLIINGQGTGSNAGLTIKANSSQGGTDTLADFQRNNGNSIVRITHNAGIYLGNVSGIAGSVNIASSSGSFATINTATLSADRTITLPNANGTVCLDSGNCGSATGTLQSAYGFSAGGTTPEIKLDNTRQGVDIQDSDTTLGSNANYMSYRASNNAGLGAIVFGWGIQGNYFQKPTADSVTVYQVQNSGGGNLFTVDSTNGRVGINLGGSANPSYTLEVKGDLNVGTGVYRSGGVAGLTATTCSGGQVMQNVVVNGGIVTGGTCTANVSTLQQAYDASTTPEIVLNATNGALTIRDASTPIGANLLEVQDNGATVNYFAVTASRVNTNVPLSIKTPTDNTTAFNIKTSLDNNAFTVDTVNSRVGIALGGNNTPTLTNSGIQILGSIRLTGGDAQSDTYTTPLSASVNTRINIANFTPAGFGQIMAMGLTSAAPDTARVISLFDARTTAHQPSLAVLSPNENNIFGLSWDGSNSVGTLKTTTDTIAIQGFSGAALNIATFKAFSSSDGRLGVNNGSPGYTVDAGGDVNSSTALRVAGTLVCDSTGCVAKSGSGFYIHNQTTLQSANMFIQASDTSVPTAQFEQAASGTADIVNILKNDGTTKYLSVSSAGNLAVANGSTYSIGSTTSGSITSSGAVTITAGGGSTWSTSSGNLTLQAGTTSALNLQTGGAGTINLGVNNTTAIHIGDGSNTARSITIGDTGAGSQAQTIIIGNAGGTSTTTLKGGTGSTAINLTPASGGSINLTTTGGSANVNVTTSGSIINKSSTDSATAYQIQNSSNASLFTVDTAGSNISLLGNNSSTLSTWNTTTALSVGANTNRVRGGAVTANGYIYHLGGVDGTGATVATTEYAKLNADGTVGTWASTTALPTALRQFQPVVMNGYVYVIGGRDNSNATVATSYYAKLNADGTIGTWNTTTALTSGTVARFGQGTIGYNGYLYVMGGFNSAISALGSNYYIKVNADGTLGSTWTATTSFSTGLANINGATTANGYAYVVGGFDGTSGTDYVRRAKLNTDGTLSSWTNQTGVVPGGGDENWQEFVANGYLYIVGGDAGSRVTAFPLNADGSVGSSISLTAFPQAPMGEAAGAAANGYFYILGGSSGVDGSGTVRNTVYYASTSRVKVGGNLDLVSFSGENLAEGSSGGQLTAGDTNIVGNMQVQGDATHARNLTVGGTLTVNSGGNIQGSSAGGDILDLKNSSGTNVTTISSTGAALFQNSTDSANALTVKSSGGSTLLNVNSTTGNASITNKLTAGSFDGAGLTDCAASNSKLLWSASTSQFSCGTDRASATVRKTVDESVTSSTAPQDDDAFAFSVGANETWAYQIFFEVTSTATGDFRASMTAPTGATCHVSFNNVYNVTNYVTDLCNDAGVLGHSDAGQNEYVAYGTIVTGANAGTVHMQWAQGTTFATATTVKAGGYLVAYKLSGADVAEAYYTHDNSIAPGDIVQVDGSLKAGVQKTDKAYSPSTLGIVSTEPGYVLGRSDDALKTDGRAVLLALNGRVPVKVSKENGPIHAGDYLTASSTPGVAMKATHAGQMIGTALEDFNTTSPSGIGMMDVFVNPIWATPGNSSLQTTATDGDVQGQTTTFDKSVAINGTLTVANTLTVDPEAHKITVGPSQGDANATVLVLGNKTTGGDPTGTNGAMYYNVVASKFRCFEGGGWKDCISAVMPWSVSLLAKDTPLPDCNLSTTYRTLGDCASAGANSRMVAKVDLTNASQARLVASGYDTLGNGRMRLQYSTDGSTWRYLDSGVGPELNAGVSPNNSPWVNLASGAKGDVWIRATVGTSDGTGTLTSLTNVSAQFK